MVDEIVTKQELIDAKRDAQDLGKAVNEKVIVSPRYGEDFKSLPMISAEFQISSDAAEAAAVSAAGSAGIATSAAQNANSSANIAEAAATAATIGAGVFDNPEAGVDPVTGVADGAYFNVRSSNDESYVDEYKNVGGVATATGKSYPSSQVVFAINGKLKRENVSVWDFFTKSELATYKAAPTVFNAYRPIKEFFDYVAANDVRVAYCSGDFYVATGLVLGTGSVRTKLIVGNATFRALNAIDIVLNINAGQDFTWLGMITTFGTGGTGSNSYNSRTCRVGVQISSPGVNSARNKYTAITANNFKEFGVFVNGVGSLSSLGYIRTSNCGSGKTTAGYSLTADFSNPVRSGGAGSISQLVTLDVTQLPPPELASAEGRALPLHAIINGKPHYVYNIDREANKIGIFPWLPPEQVSGSLIYMFGGGVCVNGGDSSVLGIEMIDAVNCGAAFVTGALYPPVIERIVSQVNGAAVVLGQNPVSAMIGGSIGTLYCEVNNFDLIRVTRSELSFNILNTVAFDHNKVAFSCATASASGTYADFDNLSGIKIFHKGVLLQYQRPNGSRATARWFNVTSPNNSDYIYYAGSGVANLTIDPPIDLFANLYGIYKRRVVVYGSGAGSKPSVVNFDLADSVNYTINSAGSTTASYTGFDGFAVFEIIYRSDTKRFFISQVSNKDTSATVTYNPPSLAAAGTAGDSVTTTVTLTGAALGNVVQAGFSQYSADIEISAAVSAANTVTVKFKNTGTAAVDLASGTLTVKLI